MFDRDLGRRRPIADATSARHLPDEAPGGRPIRPNRIFEWTMRYLAGLQASGRDRRTPGVDSAMSAEKRLNLVTGGSGYFGSLLVRPARRGRRAGPGLRPQRRRRPPARRRVPPRRHPRPRRLPAGVRRGRHRLPLRRPGARWPRTSELFWSVNRDGTRNLLQAAKDAGRPQGDLPLVERRLRRARGRSRSPATTAPEPGRGLRRGQARRRELCREFADGGLDVSDRPPPDDHGARPARDHADRLRVDLARARDVFVLGRGDNRYQFVHADDLADACLLAARRPGFAVYNIGAEPLRHDARDPRRAGRPRRDRQPGPLAPARAGRRWR